MYNTTDYHYITVVDHHQTKLKKSTSIIYYFILIILAANLSAQKSLNEQCAVDQFLSILPALELLPLNRSRRRRRVTSM